MSKRSSSTANLNRINNKNNINSQKKQSPYRFFKIGEFCIRKPIVRANRIVNTNKFNHKNKSEINNLSHCLKSMVLSNITFSKYINNYVEYTQDYCFKSPKNSFYPLKKNFQYLPISNDNVAQKNLKKNKSALDFKIKETPYGFKYGNTRIIIDKEKIKNKKYEEKKAKIFRNFSEGNFNNNELLKSFGIENIDIYNNQNIKQVNFDFLLDCINKDDIENNQNFCESKNINFKIKNFINKDNIIFDLTIFSFYIKFYYTEEKTPNIKNQKLLLPFKFLPLFYLLEYSSLKTFLSEIIYYDNDNGNFHFIENERVTGIIRKYISCLKNEKSLEYKNDSLIFNKNEFLFDNFFDFIIINDEKKLLYKLKISFPKIKFKIINNNIIIKSNLNKQILLKIISKNFAEWEKLILYDLFFNSKFRNIINSVLTNNTKYNYKLIKLNKTFPSRKKNYEFFIADAKIKSCFFFIFNPYVIFILNNVGNNKKFQKIELNLLESQNLLELSKTGGAMNTLLKCMNINIDNSFVSFRLNMNIILNDDDEEKKNSYDYLGGDIFANTENKNMNVSMNRDKNTEKYMTRYKNDNMELVLFDCLLNKIKISKSKKEKFYIKVPIKLLNAILYNKKNIPEIIFECGNEIINDEEEIFYKFEEISMLRQANGNKLDSDLEKYFAEKNLVINKRKKLKSIKYSKTKNNVTFSNSASKQHPNESDKLFASSFKSQINKENKKFLNNKNEGSSKNTRNDKNIIIINNKDELKERRIKVSIFNGATDNYKYKKGLMPKK